MPTKTSDPVSALKKQGFDVQYLSHAKSILTGEFAPQLKELAGVLAELSFPITEIIGSGGGETRFTQRARNALSKLGWKKHNFVVAKIIDGVQKEATSHEVDHVRTVPLIGTIGCEIEWNNKDPFFDRDLNNFRLLFDLRAVSVGVIVTRCDELQGIFDGLGRGKSFGSSTTHMSRLLPRIEGGGGGGCPILVLGIRRSLYVDE